VIRTLSAVMLLFAIGCSSSPTAPTSAPAAAGNLKWNAVSATCAPMTPPSPPPDFSRATIREQADGSVIASWKWFTNGREGVLYARFVQENGAWAMCSWDVADA
jgi:hypothetical protein